MFVPHGDKTVIVLCEGCMFPGYLLQTLSHLQFIVHIMVSICPFYYVGGTDMVSKQALMFPCLLFQPLTSLELWQMVKQHYGNDLGLSHEEMESLHMSETSMHTR